MFKRASYKIFGWINAQLQKAVVRNILIVGLATVIIKVIGFYKETLIASTFGLSQLLDTFYIAFLIPGFIQSVFIGSLKNVFIPNYIAELSQNGNINRGSFQMVAFSMILFICISLISLALLFDAYFLELVFSGHSEYFYNLVHSQLYILIPCLLFWGVSSLLAGLLEIEGKFLYTSIQPIFSSITIIFSLIFLRDELGHLVLAISTLTGSILSFIYLYFMSLRFNTISVASLELNTNSRIMLIQLPAKISSGFLTGMNKFVDQFFAAQLAVGSISALNYGFKIPSLILMISMIVIGNVMLPYFSKKVNENIINSFKELFKLMKILFVAGLILIGVILIYSNEIIAILFERREFTAKDTIIVSRVQQILLIYVPFYLCGNLLGKFLTSINKNRFMAWVSLYNLIANITLNIILVQYYGVYGLAISTTIVITISSFIYLIYTIKQYKTSLNSTFK